ncbi:hypothetical protein [Oleidesulfovibrio sp.]|uniref:hypothetical protein n=1 Tax=Oleidesulfovibrio sp. TaxID=2909707 RepID=UPI003A84F384
MEEYSGEVTLGGEEYAFNPDTELALIPCENCGHENEVSVFEEEGTYSSAGFACENCGHWNESK